MTRHDVARNVAPPSGDGVARAVTYEQEGQGAGYSDRRKAARRPRGRFERPGRGRVRPGSMRDGEGPAQIIPRVMRTHRLRVEGALGYGSAVTLETEIDALLESELQELVLDLADLQAIDATGVQVLVMRCEICRKRGVRMGLAQAKGAVLAALEAAGLAVTASAEAREPAGAESVHAHAEKVVEMT